MATYSGNLTFTLPFDIDCDQVLVYTAATESGSYTLASTEDYSYPDKYINYVIDDTIWYKIAFHNSEDGRSTPQSDAISGSGFLYTKPLAAFSDRNDGAPFASVEDVYRISHLTEDNVSRTEITYAISVARAYIDNIMSTTGLDRYNFIWDDSPSRRKYNANILLTKEVEINLATSIVYRNLADDAILKNTITNTKTSSSVSVGQTALGGITGADSIDTATYLDSLSQRFSNYANNLLATILPTYVPVRYGENGTGRKSVGTAFSIQYGRTNFSFSEGIWLDRARV